MHSSFRRINHLQVVEYKFTCIKGSQLYPVCPHLPIQILGHFIDYHVNFIFIKCTYPAGHSGVFISSQLSSTQCVSPRRESG